MKFAMHRRYATFWTLVLVALCVNPLRRAGADDETPQANAPPAQNAPQLESLENSPRQQVISKFERDAPQIGDSLPNLKLLDADGREFELNRLRGQPTVLVFGCLT